MKKLLIFVFMLASVAGFAQKKTPPVFREMDQKANSSSLNSSSYYQALNLADVAVSQMRRDSLHQVNLAQLKKHRKKYLSTCERNNKIYKQELEQLNKICGRETFRWQDLDTVSFRFIQITFAPEEGYCAFVLPDSDSLRSQYEYLNEDTLCLDQPVDLSDYPGILKAMANGKISQIIMAKGGTTVDTFPDKPLMAGIFPQEEFRTEAFYEEHAAVLAVRIKTLLNKANVQFPEQGFPTYTTYSQHEQKTERTFEELAGYRQGVLLYFTQKLESN